LITTGALLLECVALAGAWIWASRSYPRPQAARNLALLSLALPLAGLVLAASNNSFIVRGVLRMGCVGVLGYAILHYQLLGLDVKVRWGVKRGTLVLVFVGVFFVVTQVAQNYLSNSEGPVLGGLAAGLLLFAISPIQRLAERLATSAVPLVASPAHTALASAAVPVGIVAVAKAPSTAEEAYRAAVRLALRGGISRQEEFELARIAEAHGLGPLRALELRHEVEAERGPAARA
jgi:hypothetical protein